MTRKRGQAGLWSPLVKIGLQVRTTVIGGALGGTLRRRRRVAKVMLYQLGFKALSRVVFYLANDSEGGGGSKSVVCECAC